MLNLRIVFKQTPNNNQSKKQFGLETIESLVNNFASKVPGKVFSLADDSSFLLEQKNSFFGPVTVVDDWVAKAKKVASQLKKQSS